MDIKSKINLVNSIKKIMMRNPRKANYKFIIKDWVALKDLNSLALVLESKRFSRNIDPVILSYPEAKNILILSPHPDDDILSSGGTILKFIRSKGKVNVVYLTSGSKEPYQDNNLSSFANSVERESRMVAKSLMMEVEFWRYPSGGLKIDRETIERLRDTIVRINPEVIFMPFIADDNDDHRRSVQLFYEAFKSNKKLGFEIWAYQVYSTIIPNVIIDITEEIDEKIKLVDIWASQKARRNWAHYIKGLNAFNSRFLKTNEARYVETFFVVNGDEYMKLIANYFKSPPKDIYYTEFYRKEINNRVC